MGSSRGTSLFFLLASLGVVADAFVEGTTREPLCKTIIAQSSCIFMKCSSWRGNTSCSRMSHYCVCNPGFCASSDGTCRPDPRLPQGCAAEPAAPDGDWCFANFLGGCGTGDANDTRECDFWNSRCTCRIGSCFDTASQKCLPRPPSGYNGTRHDDCKRTPGTCSFFPCRKDRGSTECLGGLCFCSKENENWNGQICADSSPGNWTDPGPANANNHCFQDRHLSGSDAPSSGPAVSLLASGSQPPKPLALKAEEALRRSSAVVLVGLAAIGAVVALGRRRQQRCIPSDAEAPGADYIDMQGNES